MAQTQLGVQQQTQPQFRRAQPKPTVSPAPQLDWWRTASTNYLLDRLSMSVDDRITTAGIMVELAERAGKDRMLGEVLHRIQLNPPYDIFEFKRGHKKGRKSFWARRPFRREFPSQKQMEARERFGRLNNVLAGYKGVHHTEDGRRYAAIYHVVGDTLRGKKIASNEEKEERIRLKKIVNLATD